MCWFLLGLFPSSPAGIRTPISRVTTYRPAVERRENNPPPFPWVRIGGECNELDSNQRHHGLQPCALPTELPLRGTGG